MERKNAWKSYNEEERTSLFGLGERYREFLNNGKTERECVKQGVEMAKARGYRDLADLIAAKEAVKPGDKLYSVCMDKAIMLFVMGEEPLEKGLNIVGAHIDSPRMDLKQNPLYEDSDLAYLDTHYYGGIKKYQWVTLPLALHGVVAKKDGSLVQIVIGEDENDPVVGVSDLLIHLSGDQMQKKAAEVISGEDLDLIVGGAPLEGEDKDAVKAGVLKLLRDKYGIEEEDFLSAEI